MRSLRRLWRKLLYKEFKSQLDVILNYWPDKTPYRLRDALRSISIMGASGSGKSSSSGLFFALNLVGISNSGGLILASKPEDVTFWQAVFAKLGRSQNLILFGPRHQEKRLNFLDFIKGDSRNQVELLMVLSESKGASKEPFWDAMKEISIHHAIELIRLAYGEVTPSYIRSFLVNAPIALAQVHDADWQAGFCFQTVKLADERPKNEVEKFDCNVAKSYFLQEWAAMDAKVRSSILAEVNTAIHAANNGITRLLTPTTTTVSPDDMAKGKWVLVDAPIREFSESGRLMLNGWRYVTQRYILARKAKEGDSPLFIWSDEFQSLVNSFDAKFLAECRSHLGAMIVLTQSLHSYLANMPSEAANEMLTNFVCKIFHMLGDSKSAEYASSLLGQEIQTIISTSEGEKKGIHEEIMGDAQFKASMSRSYLPVLQPAAFMSGLRTGGTQFKLKADAIVITPEGFRGGERWMKVAFDQRF